MILPAIAMAGASAERVFEILDRLPDVADAPGAQPIQVTEGSVRFENVSFAYGKEVMKSLSRSVLKDISFEALPNQVMALLGPTGSGKTSIVNLIPRFYDPTAGRITIDGQDILQVTVQLLARPDRHGAARDHPVCRLDPREHHLRATRGHPGRDRKRRPRGAGGRVHPAHAAGLRHRGGRARHHPLRRAEAAPGDRPRPADRPAHPDPG